MNTKKANTVKPDKEPKGRNWAIPDQVVSLEEIHLISLAQADIKAVFKYGTETFGFIAAKAFLQRYT